MLMPRIIDKHEFSNVVTYELVQVERMTEKTVHSYDIRKVYTTSDGVKSKEYIVRRIKSKIAIDLIWEDIKCGIQK